MKCFTAHVDLLRPVNRPLHCSPVNASQAAELRVPLKTQIWLLSLPTCSSHFNGLHHFGTLLVLNIPDKADIRISDALGICFNVRGMVESASFQKLDSDKIKGAPMTSLCDKVLFINWKNKLRF